MAVEYEARVARIVEHAPDTRSLFLSGPRIAFRPGQFISCLLPVGGETLIRPYSLASSPEEDELEICLNLVPGGRASPYLLTLPVGAQVRFTGPWGTFVLDRAPEAEEVFHRHRPARHGRLGLGHVAAPVDDRALRLARAIHAHDVRAEEVDVPHHQRAGREVVGALAGEPALGGGSVVALAPHLHREARRAGEKSHAELAHVERGVGRERTAMRQDHREGHVVGDRVTRAGPARIRAQAHYHLPPRI